MRTVVEFEFEEDIFFAEALILQFPYPVYKSVYVVTILDRYLVSEFSSKYILSVEYNQFKNVKIKTDREANLIKAIQNAIRNYLSNPYRIK